MAKNKTEAKRAGAKKSFSQTNASAPNKNRPDTDKLRKPQNPTKMNKTLEDAPVPGDEPH